MKSTGNKLGIWALITALGVGLLNACGDGEEVSDATSAEQLAELKEGKDIWSIFGRLNSNRVCGKNTSQLQCQQGANSGGRRFKGSIISGFGMDLGRSGCTWRGMKKKKCQVSCDRITTKSLCIGGIITSAAEECIWNKNQRKCLGKVEGNINKIDEKIGQVFDSTVNKKFLKLDSITSQEHLDEVDQYCRSSSKTSGECFLTAVGCETRQKTCLAKCSRIKEGKRRLCKNENGCKESSSFFVRFSCVKNE